MTPNESDKQAIALRQLVFGSGIAQAARVAGVDRATVFRWLRKDSTFARQIQEARREARAAARLEMICVAPAALKVVKYAVDDEDISLSLRLTRAMKLLGRLETAEAELSGVVEGTPTEGCRSDLDRRANDFLVQQSQNVAFADASDRIVRTGIT